MARISLLVGCGLIIQFSGKHALRHPLTPNEGVEGFCLAQACKLCVTCHSTQYSLLDQVGCEQNGPRHPTSMHAREPRRNLSRADKYHDKTVVGIAVGRTEVVVVQVPRFGLQCLT
jgi:hypothetical protein